MSYNFDLILQSSLWTMMSWLKVSAPPLKPLKPPVKGSERDVENHFIVAMICHNSMYHDIVPRHAAILCTQVYSGFISN